MAKRKPVRKRRQKLVQLKHWLHFKPYNEYDEYDSHYVAIANNIADILKPNFRDVELRDLGIENEDLINFSCILTSHLEDIVNEIGIWKSFIRHNYDLYGYYLPFYHTENYEPGEIHVEDYQYLIWHWLTAMMGALVSPDSLLIIALGEEIYNYLNGEMEDAYVTDVYKDYFRIPDDIHFFELKSRMKWFAFDNYLPGGIDFHDLLMSEITETLVEYPNIVELDFMKFKYSLEEKFVFNKATSFSALTIPEWFVRVIDCSDEMRTQIGKLNERVEDTFIYQGDNESHWKFIHLNSVIEIEIVKESVELGTQKLVEGDIYFFQTLKWKDEWWVSGIIFKIGDIRDSSIENKLSSQTPFYLYSSDDQEMLYNSLQSMEDSFASYFGQSLVLFDSEKELQQAMDKFILFMRDIEITEKGNKREKPSSISITKKWGKSFDELTDLSRAVALTVVPNLGIQVSEDIPHIISLLVNNNLTQKEKGELFHLLLDGTINPFTTRSLLKSFPTKNIQMPIETSGISALDYVEFFMRFLNPQDFAKNPPMISSLAGNEKS